MRDFYMDKKNGNIVSWNEMLDDMLTKYTPDAPLEWLNWEQYYTFVGFLNL